MNLNDLLRAKNVDPAKVLVMRHQPYEPLLKRAFPWIAADRDDLFDAYQRVQGPKVENAMAAMVGDGQVAAFIGHGAAKAVFIGLFDIKAAKPITVKQFWAKPVNAELKKLGMVGPGIERSTVLLFDLVQSKRYADWKRKLVIDWPPPERSWWRRAHRNVMPVRAILEESALGAKMKEWNELDLAWNELAVLPASLWAKLAEWRVIYYIFDESDRKGYVGSAYGADNLRGRWQNYASTGHGGNRLLRQRDPKNFHFSILQRVSPDLPPQEVIRLEGTWKDRLHTRAPVGLNDN